MRKKTVIEMDYNEFDELVNNHIPSAKGKYEFCAEQEANNDTCYDYNGIDKEPLDEYNAEAIETGELQYAAHQILQHLCILGVIEPGDYIITV